VSPATAALGAALLCATSAFADSSSPRLAGYYDRFMAICGNDVYEWSGDDAPRRVMSGAKQVGVGKSNRYALTRDGVLLGWSGDPADAKPIADGVRRFNAGRSGVFVIREDRALLHLETKSLFGMGETLAEDATRIAGDAATAAIGDSTNYYVDGAGRLFVRGRAHRGQYGDGKLTSTDAFVETAENAVQVSAHTGHALHLKSDGGVWGTGGNIYGPLGRHGYGDKATRWGLVFDGARAIATGSSHTVAIRHDDSLWIWGRNEGLDPKRVMSDVLAVAAGTSATVAIAGNALWQWDTGESPRSLMECP
jgi:hypothetical protein